MTPECDGLASITTECWQRIVEYWIRFDVNNINGNWNWTLVTEIISDEANPRIGRLFGTVRMEGIIMDERCDWKGRGEVDKERQWEKLTDWRCGVDCELKYERKNGNGSLQFHDIPGSGENYPMWGLYLADKWVWSHEKGWSGDVIDR